MAAEPTTSPSAGEKPASHPFLSRRPFGPTGLEVTPLCLGGAPLANMPQTFGYEVPGERALATLRELFRSPINFLDTAANYGEGESERRIGLALKDIGGLPSGFVLATKADRDSDTGDFSGEQMQRSIERSLQLLGLDSFQIVYIHDTQHADFEYIMSKGGAVETLQRYQEQGVIRHLGIAAGPVDMMVRYVETGLFEAIITHNRYTLLNRSAEALIAAANQRGMAVANAAPYGSGILAKGPDVYPRYAYNQAAPWVVERARQMEAACGRHGVPLAAAALQFSLRDPRIHSTIVGMTRPERLGQTVSLAGHPIPKALWDELEALSVPGDGAMSSRWQA